MVLVFSSVLVFTALSAPVTTAETNSQSFSFIHELPTGETVEIVLQGAVAAYRPSLVETPAEVVLHQQYLHVVIDDNNSINNIPFFIPVLDWPGSCVWEEERHPDDPWRSNLCTSAGSADVHLVNEHEVVLDEPSGIPIWLEGSGCIKIYGGAAPEPITFRSDNLFITGPIATGGSC